MTDHPSMSNHAPDLKERLHRITWTFWRNGVIQCDRCGAIELPKFPIEMSLFVMWMNYFQLVHEHCSGPDYEEPSSDDILSSTLIDAIRECIRKAKRPLTAKEILEALTGKFEFPKTWQPQYYLKNLAIVLSKNPTTLREHRDGTFSLE